MALLEVTKKPKTRSWVATLITFLVLVCLGLFVWRIVHYVGLIRSGKMADLRLEQATEMSVSKLAASAAASTSESAGLSIENEPTLGSESAPLTVVVFADFGCPYSQQSAFTLRSAAAEYGDKVRVVYKDFPLVDLHPEAELASEAAACADDQGKFWEMHDRIYQNQSDLSAENLTNHARSLGLEMGKFISCFNNSAHQSEIAADFEEGLKLGVYGTPTFFLNGQRVNGVMPADLLRSTIEKMSQNVQ